VSAHAGTRSYSHMSSVSPSSVKIQSPGQSATEKSIILPFGKSSIIELPENLQDVIVSNPDVVEAVVHTGRRTVLIGKRAGQTNAYFYGHNGKELLNLDIRVERDVSQLKKLVKQHAPDSNVEVQAVNNNILLTGSVQNAGMADRVQKLANLWLNEVADGTYQPC